MPLYFRKEFKERLVMLSKNFAEQILEIVLELEKRVSKKSENKNGLLQEHFLEN